MTRAEEAALKAYPDDEVLFFAQDDEGGNRPVTTFGREINGFIFGYEQAEKDLGWHSVDECLPEIDEEVIVLTNVIHGKEISSARYICYGHIVNKKYCVDYDGWNIPGVKYWMKCPKL